MSGCFSSPARRPRRTISEATPARIRCGSRRCTSVWGRHGPGNRPPRRNRLEPGVCRRRRAEDGPRPGPRRGASPRRNRAPLAGNHLQWPIMHGVLHGISRDQMMARHKANHIQVAYARSAQRPTSPSTPRPPLRPNWGSKSASAGLDRAAAASSRRLFRPGPSRSMRTVPALFVAVFLGARAASAGERIPCDADWRFALGDRPPGPISGRRAPRSGEKAFPFVPRWRLG